MLNGGSIKNPKFKNGASRQCRVRLENEIEKKAFKEYFVTYVMKLLCVRCEFEISNIYQVQVRWSSYSNYKFQTPFCHHIKNYLRQNRAKYALCKDEKNKFILPTTNLILKRAFLSRLVDQLKSINVCNIINRYLTTKREVNQLKCIKEI